MAQNDPMEYTQTHCSMFTAATQLLGYGCVRVAKQGPGYQNISKNKHYSHDIIAVNIDLQLPCGVFIPVSCGLIVEEGGITVTLGRTGEERQRERERD